MINLVGYMVNYKQITQKLSGFHGSCLRNLHYFMALDTVQIRFLNSTYIIKRYNIILAL